MEGQSVIKVRYQSVVRRLLVPMAPAALSLADVKSRVRAAFGITQGGDITLRHWDKDGDRVLLSGDEDLQAALKPPSADPLRLCVSLGEMTRGPGYWGRGLGARGLGFGGGKGLGCGGGGVGRGLGYGGVGGGRGLGYGGGRGLGYGGGAGLGPRAEGWARGACGWGAPGGWSGRGWGRGGGWGSGSGARAGD